MTDPELREQVRAHYAQAAKAVADPAGRTALAEVDTDQCCAPASEDAAGAASCCPGAVEVGPAFGARLYSAAEHGELPVAAVAASLGCGNPMLVAELGEGPSGNHQRRALHIAKGAGMRPCALRHSDS